MNFIHKTIQKMRVGAALFLGLSATTAQAQITADPAFPCVDDNVTITYYADQGNQELANLPDTAVLFMHTGVITNASTTPSDWKHVNNKSFSDYDTTFKFIRIAPNTYQKTFNIKAFYKITDPAEQILKIACVIRNANGSKVGRTASGGDIFYDLGCSSALDTRIVLPLTPSLIVEKDATFNFKAAASKNATLTVKDNGTTITTVSNAKNVDLNITASTFSDHFIQFIANDGSTSDTSSFNYTVPNTVTQALPANTLLGANLQANNAVTFYMHAPNKKHVYLIGSFNNWTPTSAYQMKKTTDGRGFWLTTNIPNGTVQYQYLVDGVIRIADAHSTLVGDPFNDKFVDAATFPNLPVYPEGKTTGWTTILEIGKAPYVWQTSSFQRPENRDLIIYELLVRDFVQKHNYQTLIDTLPYLKKLGINAIELMPNNEFEGNLSWGYNPNYHMALDKYYGTPDKFKEFVDKCHQNGIAIIMDAVFNHAFGSSPLISLYGNNFQPTADNPWFNQYAKHAFNVGSDFNHESQYTKDFMFRCLNYWLTEFKVDGFRFDLSKGFTQTNTCDNVGQNCNIGSWSNYDQSRVDIWQNIYNTLQSTSGGSYVILEHLGSNDEEKELARRGMMLWGKMTNEYNQNSMGFDSNSGLAYGVYTNRGYDKPHLITFAESHDEERLMFKNISFGNASQGAAYNVRNLATALRRQEAVASLLFTVPGPKMMWQFGELGYDVNIDFNGRTGDKPIRWEYLQDPNRLRLYKATGNILHLRKTNPSTFRTTNFNANDINGGYYKHLHLSDASMNVTIVANFDVVAQDINPFFQAGSNTWYEYMTGSSTAPTTSMRLLPGEYRIYTNKQLPVPPNGYLNVGAEDIAKYLNDFQLYPNPATARGNFVGYTLSQNAEVKWEILNTLGQVMASQKDGFRTAGSYQEAIQVPLQTGTYMVRLNVNGATISKKLIVQE